MRRYVALACTALVFALAACSKHAAPPPETAATPASETTAAPPAAPADAAAAVPEAPAAPAADAATADPPAAAPTVFTPVDSPTLADIPAAPLRCKVLGQPYDAPTVTVKYGSTDWSLDIEFTAGQHFVVPLSNAPEPPGAGYTVVTAKQCCPGYLHRAEPGHDPVSLNAPNGVALELTTWDVAAWQEDAGMTQPGGKVAGRVAVVYDADNWAAGTFTTDFTYFGEPPLARAAHEARDRAAAAAAVGAWTDLPAPAGVDLAPGQKVWAAAVSGDRWTFGQEQVVSVDGAIVTLANGRFTSVGLVRPLTPLVDIKPGALVAAVDHLGAQFAKVDTVGEKIGVTYLDPSSRPRQNELAPDRIYPWATSAADPGMPPQVFFDQAGSRASGEAVAAAGADTVVVLYGGKGVAKVPTAGLAVAGPTRALKKGAKVEAVVGCGMMNSWMPRPGKVVEVLGGGVGYVVDTEPCKGVSVSAARVRAL